MMTDIEKPVVVYRAFVADIPLFKSNGELDCESLHLG